MAEDARGRGTLVRFRSRSPLGSILVQRVSHGVSLLFLLSLLSFALADLAPGDLLSHMELDSRVSAETVDGLRDRYGLDRPWFQRYGQWLLSVGQGDLGYSLAYHQPVSQLIVPRMVNSLTLALAAGTIAWGLGLLLGLLAAWHPDGWLDRVILGVNSMLLAIPDLLLALGALWLAARSGLFPVSGMASLDIAELSPWQQLLDRLWHLTLPAVTLGLGFLPTLAAHTRRALMDALNAPYVQAARAHGIGPWRIFRRYALRGAANPLITLFGLSLTTLMSGSLIVEVVLGWPGLGPLLLDAILARDTHLVLAGALLSACLLLLGNLVADLMLWHLDPRWQQPTFAQDALEDAR